MGTLATYKPLFVWCSPASIPQIVAHIQDYLVKNPIVSTETVAEIVVQSLQEHPELINGDVIPITEDSAQTIKEYIDALPSLDGYTKAETDTLLLLKQNLLTWDQTPTAGSSNPVTSEGIKAAISATAAALANLISTKADIASVYTKATTDALLLQKADAATTYSKNAVDALLDTKVDINDTYTRADIDLMKQVDKANTAIVTDGTAPFNIAAGQYLYVNDILYMATEPITERDPLVPGTNIALTPKGVTNVLGDGLQNLAGVVSTQSDQIGDLQGGLAYVENGDNATLKTYTVGEFIVWKGVLYTVYSNIPQGDPISGHVTTVSGGGLNNITKTHTAGDSSLYVRRVGNLVEAELINVTMGSDGKKANNTIPFGYRPLGSAELIGKVYNGSNYVDCITYISTSGEIFIMDFYSNAIQGIQPSFLKPKKIIYFTNDFI